MDENKTVSTEMNDDWDDIDFSDVADSAEDEPGNDVQAGEPDTEEKPTADHSEEASTKAEPTEPQTETEEKAEADHSFKLKYMGEEKEFSRDETIRLAQKGMDYDRVKTKLDEANQQIASSADMVEFVNSLAKDMGLSTDEFMLQALAGNLAKKENIGIDEAKRRINLDRREKALAAKEAAQETKAKEAQTQDAHREKVRAEIAEFAKVYPDVKVEDIPKAVYQIIGQKQVSLTAAYALHMAAEAKAALEAEKQNAENKAAAVGSASTSGKRTSADEFDAAWYDGT